MTARSTQFFEFSNSIAAAATVGDKVHLPHAWFQPVASDDVATLVCRTAVGSALNGTKETGGPERFRFAEFIRAGLQRVGDPREVVVDPHAKYFGQELAEDTLIPGAGAELGRTRYEDWAAEMAR